MILSRNTPIPISLYLDVLAEDGAEDRLDNTANDPMGRLLLHLIGRKRGHKKKIPLRLLIDHILFLGHAPCPWGSANVSIREWFTFRTLELLSEHFKIETFDPENVANLFKLSKFSRAATQLYECVNGTLMLKAGITIATDFYCWDPENNRLYQREDLDSGGWMPNSQEEPICATDVANQILDDDPISLQDIADRAGWKYNCHTRGGFEKTAKRLITLFNLRYETGADRDPVKDWDEAMSKGPRFLLAFGSGSNIQVQTSINLPRNKTGASSSPTTANPHNMCVVA